MFIGLKIVVEMLLAIAVALGLVAVTFENHAILWQR